MQKYGCTHNNNGLMQRLVEEETGLINGQPLKFSVRYKGSDASYGMGFKIIMGVSPIATHWAKKGTQNEWVERAAYDLYNNATRTRLDIAFVNRAGSTYACFDDCSVSLVEDNVTFVRDGAEVSALTPGTVTVNYTRPETDYTNPTTITMITAVYKMNDGVKTLENIYFDTDTAVQVTTTSSAGGYTGDEPATGRRPVLISRDVTIGDTGTYSINTLFWDGMSTLKPLRSNVQLGN